MNGKPQGESGTPKAENGRTVFRLSLMTENQARMTANIVIAAAAVGAALYVMRNPKLRRTAWLLARQYATGPLAAWSVGTVRTAWDASGTSVAARDGVGAREDLPMRRVGPIS
jgi:hypothetical protein